MHIVDTHAHLYHADEVTYPMKEDPSRPPAGTGSIGHLRRDSQAAGVDRVVMVQTGSAYQWDNRMVADAAAANRDWTTAVCNLDPAAPDSVDELERLVEDCNVKGLRLEPAQGTGAYYQEGSVRLFKAVQRLGAVVCAHVGVTLLGELARLLVEFPEVPVVLDHCAYPKVGQGIEEETVRRVCELSSFSKLRLKLTFGVTASEEEFPFRDTQPLLRHFIQVYGPDRCMWGSDFPTEHWLQNCTYAQHLELFTQELGLSPSEQEAVLSQTPIQLWFG